MTMNNCIVRAKQTLLKQSIILEQPRTQAISPSRHKIGENDRQKFKREEIS